MTNDMYDADRAWLRDLESIFREGMRSSPRGMPVYESLGYRSIVSMSNPIIFNRLRNLGYKFMAAEAAWILSGDNSVEAIAPYSKDISNFSDDGKIFFGAYGPKIREQVDYVVDTLFKDPDSRQAVISIWRESPGPSKDIPCTLSLQFLVRNGHMHCVASMRSSDLWLGHPYDIFNFSATAFYVILCLRKKYIETGDSLDIKLGLLYLTAGSKHLYERNIADVSKIIENYHDNGFHYVDRSTVFNQDRYSPTHPDDFVSHLWECADSKGGAFSLMFGE